jgi:AcrR family transcriptional regulator
MARPKSVSDDQVIEAARALFIELGHTAPIQTLAQRLGVSHAALFQRFGSKRALLIEAMRPSCDVLWPDEGSIGPTRERLREELLALCASIGAFLMANLPRIRVLQAAGVLPEEIFARGGVHPFVACARVEEWLRRGVTAGLFAPCDTRAVSAGIVAAVFGRVQMSRLAASHASAAEALAQLGDIEGLVDFFARGLTAEVGPHAPSAPATPAAPPPTPTTPATKEADL